MQHLQNAEVVAIRHLAPDVREMVLRPEQPFDFQPGQWISLHLPLGEKPLVRAYTMAEPAAADGSVVLCFDRVKGGAASTWLFEVEVGTRIDLSGPLGNFVLPEDRKQGLIFIGWFTGIVPFRCMLLEMERSGLAHPTLVIYGAPNRNELVYHDEMRAMAERHDWLHYAPVGAEGGAERTIDDLLASLPAAAERFPGGIDPARVHPMIAGIRAVVLPARAFFMERYGYERTQVQKETYD